MTRVHRWAAHGAEFIAAAMLAAMFFVFLLQIFSRYVVGAPLGWTLELILILWVWIVFFGNAFIVRERDHVSFDILYLAARRPTRRVFALISAAAIAGAMIWSLLPTWEYIDFLKIRKTTTVREPFSGEKIPLRTIFSIYMVFMVAVAARYIGRFVYLLVKGPPATELERLGEDAKARPAGGGDDAG